MAFKMKGSPMQRNFGVGSSPMKDKQPYDRTKKLTEQHNRPGEEEVMHNIAKHPANPLPPPGKKDWRKKDGPKMKSPLEQGNGPTLGPEVENIPETSGNVVLPETGKTYLKGEGQTIKTENSENVIAHNENRKNAMDLYNKGEISMDEMNNMISKTRYIPDEVEETTPEIDYSWDKKVKDKEKLRRSGIRGINFDFRKSRDVGKRGSRVGHRLFPRIRRTGYGKGITADW